MGTGFSPMKPNVPNYMSQWNNYGVKSLNNNTNIEKYDKIDYEIQIKKDAHMANMTKPEATVGLTTGYIQTHYTPNELMNIINFTSELFDAVDVYYSTIFNGVFSFLASASDAAEDFLNLIMLTGAALGESEYSSARDWSYEDNIEYLCKSN